MIIKSAKVPFSSTQVVLVEKLHQLILCDQIATVVISVATKTEAILAQSRNFQILKKKNLMIRMMVIMKEGEFKVVARGLR